MSTGREISIDMTTDERSTMMDEPDVEGLTLSAAARAALFSAAPSSIVEAWWFTCSPEVARELLAWGEAGMARWGSANAPKSALFRAATNQVRLALWRVGAGPPPEPTRFRPRPS